MGLLSWKQRSDYPLKGKGKVDCPGGKGDKGVAAGTSVPKANIGKGSDYPGKKGNKGVDVGKTGKGMSSKDAAKED